MEPKTQVEIWLDFAIQQLAAESYLDGIDLANTGTATRNLITERLKDGTNHYLYKSVNEEDHATRMVESQADEFTEDYQIIHHLPNRSSGFSGTLIQNRQTGEFTLSMRSTEFRDENKGGDKIRDAWNSDVADISFNGFSLAQLASMEDYYDFLINQGHITATTKLNLTSYSLSGHLATIFTEIHPEVVIKSYNFNAVGRGNFNASAGTLENMIDDYRALLSEPGKLDPPSFGSDTRLYDLWSLAKSEDDGDLPDDINDINAGINLTEKQGELPNIQYTARHNYAETAILQKYGTSFILTSKELDASTSEKIDQIYGDAALSQSDFEIVANQGISSQNEFGVLIEDQPNIDGLFGFLAGKEFRFGDTHSIILIIDSLSLTNMMQKIDPTVSRHLAESIMVNASAVRADGALLGDGVSEHNTLDNVVNSLGNIFFGEGFAELLPEKASGEFGDITYRESFHKALADVEASAANKNYKIIPSGLGEALTSGEQGIGYRYALVNLNPFVVTGFDYALHNQEHQLDLYDSSTGIGLTEDYLQSRSLLLEAKNAVFSTDLQADGAGKRELFSSTLGNGIFHDFSTELNIETDKRHKPTGQEVLPPVIPEKTRYLFGSDNSENDHELDGGSKADHIFGGGGDDSIEGGKGDDYIEGGTGTDSYIYTTGDGFDTIFDSDGLGKIHWNGQQLDGNVPLSGTNSFIDKTNNIGYQFEPEKTAGNTGILAISNLDDPTSGIRILNYHLGQLGLILNKNILAEPDINLTDQHDGDVEHNYIQPLQKTAMEGNTDGLVHNDLMNGLEGDDYLSGWDGDDVLLGGIGSDWLYGGNGEDWLKGGDNNDYLFTGAGNAAGNGIDTAFGGAGDDIILGNALVVPDLHNVTSDTQYEQRLNSVEEWHYITHVAQGKRVEGVLKGNDEQLYVTSEWGYTNVPFQDEIVIPSRNIDYTFDYIPASGSFGVGSVDIVDNNGSNRYDLAINIIPQDDVDSNRQHLFGEEGNDTLQGHDGNDWLSGGEGNDFIQANAGNDVLIGGVGEDILLGRKGNDLLMGGKDNDQIFGQTGSDRLYGDGGDDVLWGDGPFSNISTHGNDYLDGGEGDDQLVGGGGLDTLFGGKGEDVLSGDEGQDLLYGGDDNDVLFGGNDRDTLYGGSGQDELQGGDDDDMLDGGKGNDQLWGDGGQDTFVFGLGDGSDVIADADSRDDVRFKTGIALDSITTRLINSTDGKYLSIYYGQGDILNIKNGVEHVISSYQFSDGTTLDTDAFIKSTLSQSINHTLSVHAGGASGGQFNDTLRGNAFANTLIGNDGNDKLYGQSGNDILVGGSGNDRMYGGKGDDIYLFGRGDGSDYIGETFETGVISSDILRLSEGVLPEHVSLYKVNDALGSPDLVLVIDDSSTQIFLSNYFSTTDSQVERIEFDGGNGAVWTAIDIAENVQIGVQSNMVGTLEDDIFVVDNKFDIVSELPNGGIDTVLSSRDYKLPSNVENITLTGVLNINAIGNDLNNILIGNASNNMFDGKDGNDIAYGGLGDDIYYNVTTIVEHVNEGIDTWHNRNGGVLPDNVENFSLNDGHHYHSIYSVSAIGNELDNILMSSKFGISGDVLDGREGADTMIAQGFDSAIFHVDNSGDKVIASASGMNSDMVISTINYTLPAYVENLILRGSTALNGIGNELNNQLDGSQSTIANTLSGGTGDDVYILGAGDLAKEKSGEGKDRIVLVNNMKGFKLQGTDIEDLDLRDTGGKSDVFGSNEANRIRGNRFDNRIEGKAGDDFLIGFAGNDTLLGGSDNDFLRGGEGSDHLYGGIGNDRLEGGQQTDYYYFDVGDGNDTIKGFSDGSNDRLIFGDNIDVSDIRRTREDDDLLLSHSNGNDSVRLEKWFLTPDTAASVTFSDMTIWGKTELNDIHAHVNDAPAVLHEITNQFTDENSLFMFQLPADTFIDNDEGDSLTLHAILADGSVLPSWLNFDGISQTFTGTAPLDASSDYNIRVTATDSFGLTASSNFDLTINDINPEILGGTGDDTLTGGDYNDVINTGEGDDVLIGGLGDDTLIAGTGGDWLQGGGGNDTLIVSDDASWTSSFIAYNAGSPGNLGTGERVSITAMQRSHDLFDGGEGQDSIQGSEGNDALFLHDTFSPIPNGTGPRIQGIEYFNMGSGDDIVDLTSPTYAYGNVELNGEAGNDVLWGSSGDDILTGGQGDDQLTGGAGNDTYLFGRGEGQDEIRNFDPDTNSHDVLAFGENINEQQLWFEQAGNDLEISVLGTSDNVTVKDWYKQEYYQLDEISVSNGNTLSNNQVDQLVQAMAVFNPPSSGELELSGQIKEELAPVIATSWQA